MSLSAGATELGSAMKSIALLWSETQQSWNDAMAREFEEQYLKAMESQTKSTLGAMSQLGPQLDKMRRDCE